MTREEERQEKLVRAKAWCYDNNVTLEQMQNAWDAAAQEGHALVNQLIRSDVEWYEMNERILGQLFERYGVREGDEK